MRTDNEKALLIGGKSGIGKTTLVNALIDLYPELYARPVSFTTRKRRDNEDNHEYQFIDEKELFDLRDRGELLNFDYNYGNYYAMASFSVNRILMNHMMPIKEVHPRNHPKIKKALHGKCVSILLKSPCPRGSIGDRVDDDEYYSNIYDDDFDIVFSYDTNASPINNAKSFHIRISAFIKYGDYFPHPSIIDKVNKYGYNKIADYFTDEKRITTHNFHTLSESFFKEKFSIFVNRNKCVLEIGPGRGWLMSIVPSIYKSYIGLDISDEMSKKNSSISKKTASIRCIDSTLGEYDIVAASLADPYFYPEALCEIARVLKEGGYFIFSLPSHEWACALRKNSVENKTIFTTENKENIEVYSFTYALDELRDLMLDCGFSETSMVLKNCDELSVAEISPAITQAAENIGVKRSELPILVLGIFQRKEV